MAETRGETTIACPPAAAWEALAGFDQLSRWAPNVDHSSLTTHQESGIGTTRRVQVGRNALLERVTEWTPNQGLTYSIEGLPPIVRSATNTWQLSAEGDSTKVVLISRVDAGPRPPQQLIARAVCRALGKASTEMLAGLKQHLEEAAR